MFMKKQFIPISRTPTTRSAVHLGSQECIMRFPSLMPGLILVGLTACTSEPRVEPVPGAPDPTLSIAPQGSQLLLARLGERIFADDNLSLR